MADNKNAFLAYSLFRRCHVEWLIFSIVIFACAFFQILGESQDWQNYDSFFDLLRSEGIGVFEFSRFEPGFVIVSLFLVDLFSSNLVVYAVIAASVMFLKCWIINQFVLEWQIFFLAVLFYLARFAPLHELTQIRVACSSSFLLLAFVLLTRGNLRGGITACVAALVFHSSAICIIPFLFIHTSSRRNAIIVCAVFFIGALLSINLILNYFQDSINVVMVYQTVGFGDEMPNPLSSGIMLDWAMILTGLLLWDRISPVMKHILFIELVGMSFFYSSLDFAIISHRIRELFSVFWIFFAAEGLKQELLIRDILIVFVISNILLYVYLYFFHMQFFL